MLEAYTAGFLDADGSVALTKSRTTKEDWVRGPEVNFYNCDRGILESIQERWGGGIKANKPTGKNHNISYALIVSGNACLALLGDVLPYMKHSKKKRRASLIVEHYKNCTPRNGKYTPEQIEMKKWLAEEVMGITMRGTGAW